MSLSTITLVFYCTLCIILNCIGEIKSEPDVTEIHINTKNEAGNFQHFWKSTGLCSPDPKQNAYEFLLSDQEKLNLALIGAVPNQGIKQVRIHWLLNLIFIRLPINEMIFNFTYLDEMVQFLHDHNLRPGFELMGLPINITFCNNFTNGPFSQYFWKNLTYQIVSRYINIFGAEEVSSWNFETWNEPDLKSYNLLNFTLSEYLHYVNGCAEGLRGAFSDGSDAEPAAAAGAASLGGPAGLFREGNHPLCWGLLEACNSLRKSRCPIQFLSFHRKGDGTAERVLNGTLELLDLLHNKFPNLAGMPIANDEADIIKTWSASYEWRGDVRYAAMVVRVIALFHKSLIVKRKIKIKVLSNDNGFLNYHPFYFTQRTLFARFQMNHTDPPHSQFIKKPVYSAMALLSLLGDIYLEQEIKGPDALLTVLSTKSFHDNGSSVSVLIAYSHDDEVDTQTFKLINLVLSNMQTGSRFVVYMLDNIKTNPYNVWKAAGAPAFPNRIVRQLMREVEEPLRLAPPTAIKNANFNITLRLTIPSIALVYICSKPSNVPGMVNQLSAFNITVNEVLLTWSDRNVNTKCIRTYEVEFESKCDNSLQFKRVNSVDTIFLSYHYTVAGDRACERTIGRYRVRAVDYWDQAGHYSEIISYPAA